MTYLYKCDCCGKTFEDYNACQECEHTHVELDTGYHSYRQEMRKFTTWLEGDRLPRKVMLATSLDNDECDEEGKPKCDFAIYEFKRFASLNEIEKMKADHDKRMEELNKYRATHEAPF